MKCFLFVLTISLSIGHTVLTNGFRAVKEDPLTPTLVSRIASETHSLKTAILFHFINRFGYCRPVKIPTKAVKKCFRNIDAACRLIGESPINAGDRKASSRLGRLCALAHQARDVSKWLSMAAQIAQALCATCAELGTDEEKTVCEKRLCQ